MAYITKNVDVDVEIELDDVIEFIENASGREKKEIHKALTGEAKEPETPFSIPVYMRGYSAQLIALGQLEELIGQIGVEEAVTRLKA